MSIPESGKLFIGTSGFYYNHWVGKFYPENLPKYKWLTFYAQHFSSLEMNSTFYHLPKEKTLRAWYKKTPEGFKFSLKVSKIVTHIKRLKGVRVDIEEFVRLASLLKEKLGVLLFQLPGSFKKNLDVLDGFLNELPAGKVRYALEFRDHSWFSEDVYELLRKYKVALCNISSPKISSLFEVTAPFLYIRFHGLDKWYDYNYNRGDLLPWAKFVVKELHKDKDVYVYFNNDISGYAIHNVDLFKTMIEEVKHGYPRD